MPNGKIQPESEQHLREIGAFLAKNGEAVYGTRGGPVPPRNWGVTTRKGDTVYVHVLDWPDPVLALPRAALGRAVKKASLLADGTAVPVTASADAVSLQLGARRDPLDTIVVLELLAK
jgi:alpha-L-fucosidase